MAKSLIRDGEYTRHLNPRDIRRDPVESRYPLFPNENHHIPQSPAVR